MREHPLRERLRGQLMLALYRSGRQAEALEAYQDARHALTDELGIEPSQELRELQQAILRQDSSVELGPAVGALNGSAGPSSGVDRSSRRFGLGSTTRSTARATLPYRWRARHRQESPRGGGTAGRASAERGFLSGVAGRQAALRVLAVGSGVALVSPRAARTPSGAARSRRSGRRAAAPRAPRAPPGLPEPTAPDSEGARFACSMRRRAFLKTSLETSRSSCSSTIFMLRTSRRCFSFDSSRAKLARTRVLVLAAYRDVDPTLRDPLRTDPVGTRARTCDASHIPRRSSS